MALREIVIKGAREHNLKNLDLRVPRDALITITGVSGSGKSSLAFDTIFKEGQRRFVESLSAYARQFLGRMEKPRVDHVEGLSPTVSIDQHSVNRNPRSTVGTITEIYDGLRLLFARLGAPHCPRCGKEVAALGPDRIVDRIMELPRGSRIRILAPVVRGRKGEYRKELESYRLKGYVRARIDGEEHRLDEPVTLSRYKKHTIEIVLDRIVLAPERRSRVAEAVQAAVEMAEGVAAVEAEGEIRTFSARLACPDCDVDIPELEPRLFSFNVPHGACPRCGGLGSVKRLDPERLVGDPARSIRQGVLWGAFPSGGPVYARLEPAALDAVARRYGFSLDQPWATLTEEQKKILFYGSGEERFHFTVTGRDRTGGRKEKEYAPFRGIVPVMETAFRYGAAPRLARFFRSGPCPACGGLRLRPEALSVTFKNRSITDLAAQTVEEADRFFAELRLEGREELIGTEIVREIRHRLSFLLGVGLGYLRLDRPASTLSGGEAQRVRLAAQIGSGLKGVVYVLDEPSIGLHARDNRRLIATLQALRDRGNTVFVVEHDRDTMLASDYLVDLGPGAGRHGGRVVAEGRVEAVLGRENTATAEYLALRRTIPVPHRRRPLDRGALVLRGARRFNLKNVTVAFPLHAFIVVTGVSGSGKSTLVQETLAPALRRKLGLRRDEPVGEHDALEGWEAIDRVIDIDQHPIGRTPRSNPATYTKVFDLIRRVFAASPEARVRGYDKGRFSFNRKGGRCENCAGAGVIEVEMQFLSNAVIPCEACGGRRYNRETLEILYRGRNIHHVLSMTVNEALEFFSPHPAVARILRTLQEVGLGYITLGQPSTTLSGGEAQRVKLASELSRPSTGRTLYVLDEPTTGLHFEDIRVLLEALNRLVDLGNTVVVVEHNLDVIKCADHVIDLGPEGGDEGGYLVAEGTPEAVARLPESRTGSVLAGVLAPSRPCGVAEAGSATGAGREVRTAGPPAIAVRGARKNNLMSLDVDIPHNALTVITGLSGSGKSSLAFDTIFAEGQRRFVESLSTYARRFLSRMDKVPVDRIDGLAPAIAIDQRSAASGPRSTVATATEIHDYLRLLYARVGRPHCPRCGAEIRAWTPTAAARDLCALSGVERVIVAAPLFREGFAKELALRRGADLELLAPELRKEGFLRVRVDGETFRLDDPGAAGRGRGARAVDLVVDRVALRHAASARLAESLETAFRRGHGAAVVYPAEGKAPLRMYLEEAGCLRCDFLLGPLEPRMFSFNSHAGACPTCEGLGAVKRCDPRRLITRPDRPLLKGAVEGRVGKWLARPGGGVAAAVEALASRLGFDPRLPWKRMPPRVRRVLLRGWEGAAPTAGGNARRARGRAGRSGVPVEGWRGVLGWMEDLYRTMPPGWRRHLLRRYLVEGPCPDCGGGRLKPEYLAVTVGEKNLREVNTLTVDEAQAFFRDLRFQGSAETVAREILREILKRLEFLREVGVGYLTLDRPSRTLSGGEAQRIRLASQLGNRLTGVIYVLDEPTVGLHPRDVARLLHTLEDLRDLGNTVVMVEHDPECIARADHVVDLGPGAGVHGGRVVFSGPPEALTRCGTSLTGRYLSGRVSACVAPPPRCPRDGAGRVLGIRGASRNNLRNLDVDIPLGTLTTVTGVSGSGKSTLVMELLKEGLRRVLGRRESRDGKGRIAPVPGLGRITGTRQVKKLAVIDQSPIGRTPASTPATYTKVFDGIRAVFSATPEARMRGFGPGRFSFNRGAGRCPACEGRGEEVVEMHFLSDVTLPCELCRGKRYNRETLSVSYKGKNIADVLDMEIDRALLFFANHPRIRRILDTLCSVGLGYLKLGQPATTLSGGEAQRVKLAAELCKPEEGGTVYLLDEPTTGLHFEDVRKLNGVLRRLVERGNTVVVIEHNLDVIAGADHVIDLGPEGGDGGGEVVVTGPPRKVARCRASHTGRALARYLRGTSRRRKGVQAG